MRSVDGDYVAQVGEVIFPEYPTAEQLNQAFPTYNNGVPILTIQDKTAEIKARYQIKLDQYKDLIVSAISADGPTKDAKVASFSTKYNLLLAQKNTELEALYND